MIDDHEVVRRDRPKAHGVGGIRLMHPMPLPFGMVHEPFFGQQLENGRQRDVGPVCILSERLIVGERQLERRALDMVEQDMQVVGVESTRARVTHRRRNQGAAPRTGQSGRCWPPARRPIATTDDQPDLRAAT